NGVGTLVGVFNDGNRLVSPGRFGTGYSPPIARDLFRELTSWAVDKPPFDDIPRAEARRRDVQWVEPKMVIEAHFRGWTADNLVRQAAFKGVREDKSPHEVVREVAVMKPRTASTRQAAATTTGRLST